ncbi:unnamed protein product [Schistosoma margrebowiei]|uniref:Uncharacterized protein n=1 Tax=Schistosoma margrebowiei TaxID=48269 RepID=A0A183M9A4_9TREM|nr:unnamed protein product [Schistosoma margrebowiei]
MKCSNVDNLLRSIHSKQIVINSYNVIVSVISIHHHHLSVYAFC